MCNIFFYIFFIKKKVIFLKHLTFIPTKSNSFIFHKYQKRAYYLFRGNSLKQPYLSFYHKIALKKEMTKITHFYFENFNNYFFKKKFETISPKLHPLTLNHKSRLVNPKVKIHFYHLIKLITTIFFIEGYFCDKNLKITILGNFSIDTTLENYQVKIHALQGMNTTYINYFRFYIFLYIMK